MTSPRALVLGPAVYSKDGVFILTSQEKWTKAKVQFKEVWGMLEKDLEKLSQKQLEQVQLTGSTQ
jgi:hypothetical protein